MSYRPVIKRPKLLVNCAALYAAAPLLNLIVIALLVNKPLFGDDGFLPNVHPLLLLPIALNPIVAFGIYSTRPWGWYTFLGYSAFLVFVHIWVIAIESFPVWSASGIFALTGFTAFVLLSSGGRAPFFNPRVRKWDQEIRYRAPITVRVYCGDLIVDSQTLDISKSGCFIRMGMNEEDVGAPVMVTFDREGDPVHAIGEVVRVINEEDITGVGVRFMSIDRRSIDNLGTILTQLKAQSGEVHRPLEDGVDPKQPIREETQEVSISQVKSKSKSKKKAS